MFTFRRPLRPLLLLVLLPCGMSVARAVPVTLRVLDDAKNPVAGAAVQYIETRVPKPDDDELASEQPVPRSALTGADGTVTLDLPAVVLDEVAQKRLTALAARAKAGAPTTPVSTTPVLGNARVRAPGLALGNVALRAGDNSVTLGEAARMSGLVRDATGAPLASARVKLLRVTDQTDQQAAQDYFYFDASGFAALDALTDAQGRWVLDELPRAGLAALQASAPGRVSAQFRAWLEGPDNSAPPQKLEVGGTITGRLVNQKGEPVAGAQVYRSNAYDGINLSDKEGRFTLEGVPVGQQQLQIWSLKAQWFAGDTALTATVAAGGGAVDLGDLVSGEGTLVSGVVLDKASRQPLPGLELRLENQKVTTDAAGRFEGRVGSGYLQLEVVGDYVASGNNFRQLPARATTYDAGQILVERAVALPLDVRDEKGETVLETAVMLSNGRSQQYANFDGETQKVGPLQAGDYQIKGYGSWQIIEPKTASVPAFSPVAAPATLTVKVRRMAPQKIAGRVVDAGGAPIANATVAISPGGEAFRFERLSALSRRDGSWETEFSPDASDARGGKAEPTVGEVKREGYTLLRGGEVKGVGDGWRADDLVMARSDATLGGRVVSAEGAPVPNASLSWTGAKIGEFARTDAQGKFELTGLPDAPLQLRVSDGPRLLETRELTPGEMTDLALPAPAQTTDVARAEALWKESSASGIGGLDAYFEALGAPRLLEAALRADAAQAKPADADKIGPNLDAYLAMLTRHRPTEAARQGVALVADKSLGGAGGVGGAGAAALALAGARSDDEGARAWAGRWFDAQKDEFSMQQEGNKGVVAALRLAAVGARLGRDEAVSYRDLALVWSDRVKDESRAYSLDDWGALLWAGGPEFFDEAVAEWPALDRLAALSGALGRVENAAQGRALLERLETLAKDPEVARADAARAEKQPYAESLRDRALQTGRANFARALASVDPAAALDEMEKVTDGYAIQNTAVQIADEAIAGNQPEIARRALRLGFKNNYSNRPGTAALAMLAQNFDPALLGELLTAVRASVLPDQTQTFGNQDWLSVANYAVALREVEPGTGRLLLEQEWARRERQKPAVNERWQRANAMRELARAMAFYDVERALQWAATAGEENNGGANLRTSIVAAALAAPAQRPFALMHQYN